MNNVHSKLFLTPDAVWGRYSNQSPSQQRADALRVMPQWHVLDLLDITFLYNFRVADGVLLNK